MQEIFVAGENGRSDGFRFVEEDVHIIQKYGKSLDEVLIAVREALDKTEPLDLEPAKGALISQMSIDFFGSG